MRVAQTVVTLQSTLKADQGEAKRGDSTAD